MEVMMKRTVASLAVLMMMLLVGAALGAEHHVKAKLVPIAGSGVTGFVQLTQLPHGGTNLHVIASGLHPEGVYASFYYESSDCSAPFDLLGAFTANAGGIGVVHGKIDDDLDEVGSVSVRIGPDYGTLLACATVH
jgi:hypothetical protein